MIGNRGLGKPVAELFFERENESNIFTCKCGTKRKRTGTSYQNLLSHVQSSHPNYFAQLQSGEELTQKNLHDYFTTTKSNNIYGWLDLILNGLLPFSFVEKNLIRQHVRHSSLSLNTFMKYVRLLTEHVEEKIAKILPPKFAFVFDGWSTNSTNYLAIFATFPTRNSRIYDKRLLTFSPMGDESSLDTNEHFQFLSFVLGIYHKSWTNVLCLIGDNVNTNKALSNRVGLAFIGCASHRFNLAMRDLLFQDEALIVKVTTIMKKLRGLLFAARLKKVIPLRPKVRNVTRWSSTFEMLARYSEIREHLSGLDSIEIDPPSLSPSENRNIDILMKKLRPLESVTKALQSDATTMGDVRVLFTAVMDDFPETRSRLGSNATIVHCVNFENAKVKLQRGNFGALTMNEQESTSTLRGDMHEQTMEYNDENLSFAERALKRRKRADDRTKLQYMDSRFLIPTSNICERLFSRVGYALPSRRKGTSPVNLEAQVFLYLNRDLWGSTDVNRLTLSS